VSNLSIRAVVAVAFLALTVYAAPSFFSGGDGSASSPYLIAKADDLMALATFVNAPFANASFADRHYRLASDIDLSACGDWTPIGVGFIRVEEQEDRLTFRGVFDGAGKSIANMKIASVERIADSFQGCGLFGVVDGGTVQNVGLERLDINIKTGRVGGIAGAAVAGSVIKDCYVRGAITGLGSVGGIVGHADDSSAITDCYVFGDVSGTDRVGGIAGHLYNGIVTGSYAVGRISDDRSAVGVAVGHVWNSLIAESGVFDPETNADAMLANVPEHLLACVMVNVKNAPPIVAVVKESTDKITVGPNPVRLLGAVNFFRSGTKIKKGTLSIYNRQGKIAKRLFLTDMVVSKNDPGWRQVGSWDLKDANGSPVSEGTYLVKGTIKMEARKAEKIALLINVLRNGTER